MYDDEFSISFKTVFKWFLGFIIAIIILIPIGFVLYLNIQTPVFSYNYINTNNIMQQLTKDVKFNTETKGVSIRLTPDIMNSFIDDEIKDLDLGLPDKIQITDIHLDTEKGRAFLNLKAYGIKIPLSAAITLTQSKTQATISFSSFRLADIPISQDFIKKYAGDKLSYTIKLGDINVIPYFDIKTVSWKSSGINLFYEIDYEEVYRMLRRRPDQIASEIAAFVDKNQRLAPMLDLVTYLANSEQLTINEIKYYLDMLLSNQDVADTLIEMVKSGAL